MINLLKHIVAVALLFGLASCDNKKEVTPIEQIPNVELNASRQTIVADGEDCVNFTVEIDGVVTTEGCKIMHASTSEELPDFSFTTTEAGIYTFVALYDDVVSNVVTVVATEVGDEPNVEVELSVNTQSIIADGDSAATFTVKVNGEEMEEGYSIINIESGDTLAEPLFATTVVGIYTFKAYVGELESNVVTIEAMPVGEEPDPTPEGKYKPGDLYDVDGVKGVVFYVNEDGESGLMMSMDQAALAWSTENELVGCFSSGEYNTEDMLKRGEDKYPAAKWCVDHGEGWYMPNSADMHKMWTAVSNGKHVFDEEFVKLYNDKLDDPILEDYYWSSTEIFEEMAEVVVFIDRSVICLESYKYKPFLVRAVRKF